MTLEDFLTKAGAVKEEDIRGVKEQDINVVTSKRRRIILGFHKKEQDINVSFFKNLTNGNTVKRRGVRVMVSIGRGACIIRANSLGVLL